MTSQRHYIGFIPPVVGVEGEFNTFRLGGFYKKVLNVGDEVFLTDEKARKVIGRACVTQLHLGMLSEMCVLYGADNHTNLVPHNDSMEPGQRLFGVMTKIYGPHIAKPNKLTTVIYLRRLE